jgi:serine/threonine-protein kinase
MGVRGKDPVKIPQKEGCDFTENARAPGRRSGRTHMVAFRPRQKIGKYRIERLLSEGGFAAVYRAMDTVEGVRVALKIPYDAFLTEELLDDFRHEVRVAARLEHPNILPLKNAAFIDKHFVIAFPLGERTLADRLQKRISFRTALDYGEQLLQAVAYAHRQRIIHCDIKPENIVLFQGDRLRLGDFGIAKVAHKTVQGRGTGTVGYMAPEQAMGHPSQRSDVFSIGLILYRMLTSEWPTWPYAWPPPGYHRLRGRAHVDLIALIRRAIDPDPRRRFQSAEQMLTEFRRIKYRALHHYTRRQNAWASA